MRHSYSYRRKIRKRNRPLAVRGKWKRGWRVGYREGWDSGYHLGQCDWIASLVPAVEKTWDIKVLYVQAQGAPYKSLDEGIESSLRGLVREVVVAGPGQDAVRLAEETRPDLVLVLDALGITFTVDQADRIRALGLRTAVWLPDDPYHSDTTVNIASHYDYVFTFEASCVPMYQENGCREVHYLPAGVNPRHIRPEWVEPSYRSDICFIGSAYWNRVALFDEMASYLARKNVKIIGYWWERLRNYSKLKSKIFGHWISPEEAAKYYTGAKIVINLHRSADDPSHNSNSRNIPALSVNPRLFEIAVCGTLQLTDLRELLPEMYTPGEEIVTFDSAGDLMRKLDYYLARDAERCELARRTLVRTVRDHNYESRLSRLLQIIFPGG